MFGYLILCGVLFFFGGYHSTTTAEQGQRVGAKLTSANLELML